MIQKNSIVTVDMGNSSSNTFIVDTVEEHSLLLTHPLSPGVLVRVSKGKVDLTSANIKDSSERGIDYANSKKSYLDYNGCIDLEALGICFVLKRKLTPRQKHILADLCGVVASHAFNDNLNEAMHFITKNKYLLDEYNHMWFNNFNGLFSGSQIVTSKKQRSAVFNIAGYLLAELENPIAKTRK